ncbi:PaaI family thioesterase [Bacillus salipaludis]|uniref:PaaI family thioesterase n=1 Tax=Bacillus salipaludis TaxID=2547811 RepID=UPI003D1F0D83
MTTHLEEKTIHEKHYEQIVDLMKNEPYGRFLGMKLTKLGLGTAAAELTPDENMLNAHGTVHGGVIFSLAVMYLQQLVTHMEKQLLV